MSTFIEIASKYRNRIQYANPADFQISATQTNGWSSLTRDVLCVRPCAKKEACNKLYCVKLLKLMIPIRLFDSDGATTEYLARDPYNQPIETDNTCLYVHLSTDRYNDSNLIRMIDDKFNDATFVAVPERTITGEPHYAYLGAPNQNEINIAAPDRNAVEWLSFRSDMTQCIRLDDKKPAMYFRIFTNQDSSSDGAFIPVVGGPLPGFSNTSNSIRIYGDNIATTDMPDPTRQIRALFELTPYTRDGDFTNNLVQLWGDN